MSGASVLEWAFQTGLAVTLLVAFVLIIRRPFARYFGAQAAYALWCLPVIRLFLPEMNIPILKPKIDVIMPNIEAFVAEYTAAGPASEVAAASTISWTPIILTIWLGGAGLWLIYQLLSQSQYMNAMREKTDPADSLSSQIDQAVRRSRLKAEPDVRLARDNSGPMVTGVMRPLIILPRDFQRQYSSQQQIFALMHECTHIRRKDMWVAMGVLLFRAINWPNPLIHYAAHKFRTDQEAACDAAVLRLTDGSPDTAHGYAETLIHAAKYSNSAGAVQPLGLTIHHPLKERLMILKTQTQKAGTFSRLAAASTIAIALTATAPLTLAASDPGETTVEVDTKNKSKKVIKWTQKDDIGNETSKHYEIITENGETTAWEIDAFGNKTEVDVNEVKGHGKLKTFGLGGKDAKVKVLRLGDGNTFSFDGDDEKRLVIEKIIEESEFGSGEDMEFPEGLMTEDHKVIIKRLADGKHSNVFAFSSNGDVEIESDGSSFVFGGQSHTKSLVTAAEGMLSNAKTDDLSSSARRKLEKAQKALKEAKEALEAEE